MALQINWRGVVGRSFLAEDICSWTIPLDTNLHYPTPTLKRVGQGRGVEKGRGRQRWRQTQSQAVRWERNNAKHRFSWGKKEGLLQGEGQLNSESKANVWFRKFWVCFLQASTTGKADGREIITALLLCSVSFATFFLLESFTRFGFIIGAADLIICQCHTSVLVGK